MPFVFDGAYNVTSNSAELWFEFTGGDASYGNYRPLRLTISGTNYNNRVFDSDNKGGGDSWWEIPVSGLAPDTKYTVKAQLGFYTGQQFQRALVGGILDLPVAVHPVLIQQNAQVIEHRKVIVTKCKLDHTGHLHSFGRAQPHRKLYIGHYSRFFILTQ